MSHRTRRTVTAAPLPRLVAGLLAAAVSPSAWAVGDFKINLYVGSGLAANPAAVAAFQRAAADWESRISNPIRVNIEADLGTFSDPNIIGATGWGDEPVNLPYDQVRDAMAARANRPGNGILAYLPTSAQITASIPNVQNASFDKTTLGALRANQKALGLIANPLTDPLTDGTITFNSAFTFDYDRSDGIDANKMDFQTVATHEIGHVLGFLSDTDDYDRFGGGIADNATTLDLFRFAADNKPTTPEQFRNLPRELRPGVEAVTTDLANEYPMSTGFYMGDGNQASHWKDDFLIVDGTLYIGPLIGIMDPTLAFGVTEEISDADLRAMELIGYDVVPEPGTASILVLGVSLALTGRRRAPR
jgi:hypothetical protein